MDKATAKLCELKGNAIGSIDAGLDAKGSLAPVKEASEEEEKDDEPEETGVNNDKTDESETDEMKEIIKDTHFMRLDEELPQDDETQRNTLQNALSFQLSNDELRDIGAEKDATPMSRSGTQQSGTPLLLSPVASVTNLSERRSESAHSFRRGVTLDTFNAANGDITKLQITSTAKNDDYVYTKTARTILCTYDLEDDAVSVKALRWAMEDLVNDFDTLVVLSVLEPELQLFEEKEYKVKCDSILEAVTAMDPTRKIKLVVELKVGDVRYNVAHAMNDYEPNFMIVGTKKEKTGLRSLIAPKTMAKYFLEYGVVPVIVINPLFEENHTITLGGDITDRTFVDQFLSVPCIYTDPTAEPLTPTSSAGEHRARFLRHSRSRSPSADALSPARSRTLSPLRFLKKHI